MIEKDDSAFPINDNGEPIADGLTKREYFAAMAMQGLCSFGDGNSFIRDEMIPKKAVELADALIAELNKKANK